MQLSVSKIHVFLWKADRKYISFLFSFCEACCHRVSVFPSCFDEKTMFLWHTPCEHPIWSFAPRFPWPTFLTGWAVALKWTVPSWQTPQFFWILVPQVAKILVVCHNHGKWIKCHLYLKDNYSFELHTFFNEPWLWELPRVPLDSTFRQLWLDSALTDCNDR